MTPKQQLQSIISGIDDLFLRAPVTSSSEETTLADLGIDSLGRITLFYGIIDHFGVNKDEGLASDWKTLKDILEFMKSCES